MESNYFLPRNDILYYFSLEGLLKKKYENILKKKKKILFLKKFFENYHFKEINFLKIFFLFLSLSIFIRIEISLKNLYKENG
jgi:hypothetical protein